MDTRFPICVGIPVVVAAITVALSLSPAAQTPAGVRRAPDGKADLSGVWQSGGVSLYGDQGRAGAPTAPAGAPPDRRSA